MSRHIVIIQGHPDPRAIHFGHALGAAYARGAEDAGHEVKRIDVARLDFPMLRSAEDFQRGQPPESIRLAQDTISWADHLVILFPLWLGTMPALLKAFLEQVFRPSFAFARSESGGVPHGSLKGKSARVIVTMGMPAPAYRWFFLAQGVRGLERSILSFAGIGPVKETLIGSVEAENPAARNAWLRKVRVLGRKAH